MRRKRTEHAKLGMTVRGSDRPEDTAPEPGTPAFGMRAEQRRRKLQGKRPFRVIYDASLKDKDRRA